jgi:hypothetical protein
MSRAALKLKENQRSDFKLVVIFTSATFLMSSHGDSFCLV